jgi:hypothetical protein
MNLLSRFKPLLFIPVFLLGTSYSFSQDIDYLRHGKLFDLCSYKRECSHCNGCDKQRFLVKINNKEPKSIKKVSYVFYSEVFNKVMTKEAEIKGSRIDAKHLGLLNICVPDGNHWAISEITYNDDSKKTFVVHERLSNFQQEPDECDCND